MVNRICPNCYFSLSWSEGVRYNCGHVLHEKCTFNHIKCPICHTRRVKRRCLRDQKNVQTNSSNTILHFLKTINTK